MTGTRLDRLAQVVRTHSGAGSNSADLPVGAEKRAAVRDMFDAIAPRYDVVNKMMTFGLDVWWRRRTLALLELSPSARVLDLACGTGDFSRLASREGARPVGVDLSAGMLANARPGKAPLVRADAVALPFPPAVFDGAVSGFALRNFSDLPSVFAELARVVRPGGRIALLEVSQPEGALLVAGHRLWFNEVVPRLGGLVSDAAAYRYLPRSVAYLPRPGALLTMLATAGFASPTRHVLSGGIVQVLTGTRRP